ncbi:ribose-phosphate diphosphokinase [Candidatus Woesearchaeota archaeon]|nr:ribose-phosphate diphosphokinase [Candidatus Woesearchaeota archaeon]
MIVVSCSHGAHLGTKVAKLLHKSHSALLVDKFPDGELRVRLDCDVEGKEIVLVQSFYKDVSDCLIEMILSAHTAAELGAKKVILVAPYFPYMRQDKRFRQGEAVSQKIIASLVDKYFDAVYIMDPHLHREDKLEHVFRISSKKLTANSLIADYIRKNIRNPVIIGPDEESYKWARHVAEMLGAESRILMKKRYSSYHVKVTLNKKLDFKGRNIVIVDDIISTGHTILETAKELKKLGAKNIHCICVHGIFANNAISKLRKAGIKVVSTNTVPSKFAKIDVSGVVGKSVGEKTIN